MLISRRGQTGGVDEGRDKGANGVGGRGQPDTTSVAFCETFRGERFARLIAFHEA